MTKCQKDTVDSIDILVKQGRVLPVSGFFSTCTLSATAIVRHSDKDIKTSQNLPELTDNFPEPTDNL